MLIKSLKQNLFLLFFFYSSSLFATFVDINQSNFSLLEYSSIYLDENNLSLENIIKKKLFKPYHQKTLNIGTDKKVIWVKVKLQNKSQENVSKILLLYSNFLEHIYFYNEDNVSNPMVKGQAHTSNEQKTLFHYYNLSLSPNTTKTYYIKTYSNYVSIRFALSLEEEKSYLKTDNLEQIIDVFLIGFIFALMLYSLFISAYIKDKSYFFYSIYLFILLYDQTRFMGLSQLYYPKELMLFDLTITITRIYALVIASSFFTIYFLDLKKYFKIWTLYRLIILISFLAIIFLDMTQKLSMTLALILMLFLAIYNLFVGIYAYFKGEKQARLYILGFGIVFVSYLMIIADIVGLISMTQKYPNALLFTTAFEALILSLAFADRYMILEDEKKGIETLLLKEANTRELIITKEVILKTEQLQETIKEKEFLLQEVHHRVKNNLQIILSMIELQNNKSKDSHLLDDLENRINAIAKTYEMLISSDDLQKINMKEYIESLLADISETFSYMDKNIQLKSKINSTLALKDAIYVGLIINELITNSYKYAFDKINGTIYVKFIKIENNYQLTIKDTGKGFIKNEQSETLGLQLVHTLIYDNLRGTLKLNCENKCEYIIQFKRAEGA